MGVHYISNVSFWHFLSILETNSMRINCYGKSQSPVSYLELRTTQSTTILIRDNRLPSNTPGRLNLYNTNKNAFIEYDESIVTAKLFPLSDPDAKAAMIKYEADWKAARAEYRRIHKKPYKLATANNTTNNSSDDDEDLDEFSDDIELSG